MSRILWRDDSRLERIIAISDVHGHADLFLRALDRIDLRKNDLLVLVGDYINRGHQSREMLRILMELDDRENVVILKGNMDRLVDWYFHGDPGRIMDHLLDYRARNYGVLFDEWAAERGIAPATEETFSDVRAALAELHEPERRFIRELPLALDTPGHLFVHAGLGNGTDWHDSTDQELIKNDPFLMCGENRTGKTVVVGHMPVWNSHVSENTNNPICDGRNILGIDGGIGVKNFSQLNILTVIRDGDGYRRENDFVDEYPRFRAACAVAPEEDQGCFKDSWPDYQLTLLELGAEFSLCRLRNGDRQGLVKNEHLLHRQDGWVFGYNTVSTLLPVREGEELALLHADCGNFAFVKNSTGHIGWIPKRAVPNR